MKLQDIYSHQELTEYIKKHEKVFVLLYKPGSELSDCALKSLEEAYTEHAGITLLKTDVSEVRDIHINYNVSTVPTILSFEQGTFINVIKGCMDKNYYQSLFGNAIYTTKNVDGKVVPKRVTVYSTPTCSWCTTIKNYLKKNNIKYRDIDVSKDEKAAQEMVRKSGQQGVPQTDINGQIVVGFDQKKIDRLLGIA